MTTSTGSEHFFFSLPDIRKTKSTEFYQVTTQWLKEWHFQLVQFNLSQQMQIVYKVVQDHKFIVQIITKQSIEMHFNIFSETQVFTLKYLCTLALERRICANTKTAPKFSSSYLKFRISLRKQRDWCQHATRMYYFSFTWGRNIVLLCKLKVTVHSLYIFAMFIALLL